MEMEENKPAAKLPDVTIIKLDFPVEYAGEVYSELKMGRPKGKHLKGMKFTDMGYNDMAKVASKVSRVSTAVFDEMDSKDLNKVWDFLGEHL